MSSPGSSSWGVSAGMCPLLAPLNTTLDRRTSPPAPRLGLGRVCDHPRMVGRAGPRGHSGRIAALALTAVLVSLLAGCASTSSLPGHRSAGVRLVGEDGPAADPAKVAVVRRWAAALRAGDLRRAAAYFHLPSLFDDGAADTATIRSLAQAEAVNATLPCGAVVISAFRTGRLIDVLFRLTARAGQGGGRAACGAGIGQSARSDFLIQDGRILEWLRAPSLPGDPGVPGGPSTRGHQGRGGGRSGGSQSGGGGLPA